MIIITDLYSALRSKDTEALDAAQEDQVSLNRLVFQWCLKVRMFPRSRMSVGREFQMDGAATKKRDGRVRCVCEEWGVSEHRKSTESEVVHGSVPARWDTLEWLWSTPCESVEPLYTWPAASPEASVASEAAAWRRCDPSTGRRLWSGCSGCTVVCQKSPPVCHSTVHCSSPAWKWLSCWLFI